MGVAGKEEEGNPVVERDRWGAVAAWSALVTVCTTHSAASQSTVPFLIVPSHASKVEYWVKEE